MVCSVLKKQLVEGCHLTDSLLPTAFYSSHLTPMASESVSRHGKSLLVAFDTMYRSHDEIS